MKKVYLNSRYVEFKNAKIHIEDRGLQFSDSVYEVVPFYNRKLITFVPERIFYNPSTYLSSSLSAFIRLIM